MTQPVSAPRAEPEDRGVWEEFVAAADGLRERRRSQRGMFTHGDDADLRLVRALARLRLADDGARREAARDAGAELGRSVYARRMFEDTVPGAYVTLSASLAASGFGVVRLVESFHRTSLVDFAPAPALQHADEPTLAAFLGGLLEGFLGEAFNCEARAAWQGDGRYDVRLGEGRDVNRRPSA